MKRVKTVPRACLPITVLQPWAATDPQIACFVQDITKLVQLDTDLADVVAALQGGLAPQFIRHMISRKISFQVGLRHPS